MAVKLLCWCSAGEVEVPSQPDVEGCIEVQYTSHHLVGEGPQFHLPNASEAILRPKRRLKVKTNSKSYLEKCQKKMRILIKH